MRVSRLEDLPNEILFDIFSLIRWYDLIHINISSFNRRLGWIIRDMRVDLFQLDRLSKDESDRIPMQLCSSNIYSLSLSNAIIPDQIKQFFSMIDIKKLNQLKSLTLNQPTEFDLTKFLPKLLCLPRLNMLKIDTQFKNISSTIPTMQSHILSQPHTTLSKLSLINSHSNFIISMDNLFKLFLTYPSLEYLTITLSLNFYIYNQPISLIADKLKYLNVTSNGFALNEAIINCMPNIRYLTCIVQNAQRTEIIGSFIEHLLLPLKKLKRLNLFLCYNASDFTTDEMMNEMKISYETNFWIVNHEWYVNIQQNGNRINVYTIPFPLTTLDINLGENFRILTTAHHDHQIVFNNVKILNLMIPSTSLHFPQQIYPNVSSLQILGNTNSYDKPAHLHTFLEQSILFKHLIQLTLSYPCMINRQFYLTLFQQSSNLIILNMSNYNQLVELTNSFRHRPICSLLQKQIKKLIINDGHIDYNDQFIETFTNLKILTCTFHNIDQLYFILPKLCNKITNLTLIQLKSIHTLDNTFQENFRIWLTKNTSMTNTRNTIVRCHSNMITIWNGQRIDPILSLF